MDILSCQLSQCVDSYTATSVWRCVFLPVFSYYYAVYISGWWGFWRNIVDYFGSQVVKHRCFGFSGSPAQSDSTNSSLQILHSLPLCGKMCGTFTVASTECDNVVIEMGDVHKVQRPDVLPWQRHHLVQQFSTGYV